MTGTGDPSVDRRATSSRTAYKPAERAYLDALAARLRLPAELRATLAGTALPSRA